MLNFTTLPPLSLYIHYPWCIQKCPYCDFNSHTVTEGMSAKQRDTLYIQALIHDLELELPDIWGRSVQTIFIGGGTPSLMQPELLQQLLSQIRARIKISPLAEITLEANPGTVDYVKFAEFHDLGINRLSIGIQSFNDHLLSKIGRIHNAQQARLAIDYAQRAGFDNINLDLMFALPDQTLQQALEDVQQAIAFNTTHISHYQLTLEANTLFAHQPPTLPNDDLSYDMQLACQQLLSNAGFHHYEISAYAQAGKQCRHNMNYWQFGDYVGIGAGAHGKISNAYQQKIIRRWKEKHPLTYMSTEKQHSENSTKAIKSSMIGGQHTLSLHDICFEFMLNSSRLVDGFDSQLFFDQTSLPITHLEEKLRKAEDMGLIQWQKNHIKPTQQGLTYLNELQELFL